MSGSPQPLARPPFRRIMIAALGAVAATVAVALPAAAAAPADSHPSMNIHTTHHSVAPGQQFEVYGKVLPASDAGQVVDLQRWYPTLDAWRTTQTQLLRRQVLPMGNTAVGFVFICHLSTPASNRYRVYWPKAADHAALVTSSEYLLVRGTRQTPKIHIHATGTMLPGALFAIHGPVTPSDLGQKVNLQIFLRSEHGWAIIKTTTLKAMEIQGGTVKVGYNFNVDKAPTGRIAYRVTWPAGTNHGPGISRVAHVRRGVPA